ncbi:hypothetical protein [Cellulosilyticum sp. WCF-2]|uniref:hypothetical protein n=1 Tax=Cellulosilyticum sp. WCF-2 TaxID=2497860 RepID=UPI000F8D00C2|nr:hypothetical protein [Cellulosilyticum sp. WCF-2]QEH67289.1 hypothetical protein EKH84_02090 [Cellulosilyticum sp. WCF-2]QEH68198.1 hypothetical protein EKH84_07275 [Cellulosilyticum sp. WCF-2]
MNYRCTEGFQVQLVDDDGFEIENESFSVDKGSEWFIEDYIETWDEVFLRQLEKDKYGYIKINKDTLDSYFEEF